MTKNAIQKPRQITSAKTGKVYEIQKMRTEDSFWLSVYHYRRLGDGPEDWRSLHVDTIAQAKEELHA